MTNTLPKIALVTGASRGIGRAISLRLAEDGFVVIINYLQSSDAAQQLCSEIANKGLPEAWAVQADVSNPADAKRLFLEIKKRYGNLSVLVNNAGVTGDKLFLFTPDDTWWQIVKINLGAVVNCCRMALPLMMARGSGIIINMSSISGQHGAAGQTAYASSKAAIVGFSKALAKEVSQYNISINCVSPGLIDTDMVRRLGDDVINRRLAQNPLQRLGRPDEVAEVIAMLASGRVGYLHGQVITIDGGTTM